MEPPFAQSGEVRRKVAERPSQEPISRIRGSGVLTSGIMDVQRGILRENQSWVSVNLYPLDSLSDGMAVESWCGDEPMHLWNFLQAYHAFSRCMGEIIGDEGGEIDL